MVKFIFEDGDKHKGHCSSGRTRLLGGAKPNFEPKGLAPLQACDFVLWEQFNLAKDRLKNPRSPAQAIYAPNHSAGVSQRRRASVPETT